MRKISIFLMILTIFIVTGCNVESSDKQLKRQTEEYMKEANAKIGMPAIKNFQERKLAKMIFELRDQEGLICYAYIVAKNTGKLIYLGKCIGYGLPYSVQYTNPLKVEYNDGTDSPMPQADPNGLFMPQGLSATWIMLIDPKTNKPRPVYVEPEIIVSPFMLH